jgi:hypothetical protein
MPTLVRDHSPDAAGGVFNADAEIVEGDGVDSRLQLDQTNHRRDPCLSSRSLVRRHRQERVEEEQAIGAAHELEELVK